MTKPKQPKRTGPKPETVKLKGPWEKAVRDALKKERPAEGWPDVDKKKRSK